MLLSDKLKNVIIEPSELFKISKQVKDAKKKYGKKNVVDAIIGVIYDENEDFFTFKTVEENYRKLSNEEIFNYADEVGGTTEFKEAVKKSIFGKNIVDFANCYIGVSAASGGTGVIQNVFRMYSNEGDAVLLPNFIWNTYKQIVSANSLNFETYNMFKNNKFDIENFKEKVFSIIRKQKRILIVINDPCHNPSGYSFSQEEWKEISLILKEASNYGKVILLNDIAYIEYDLRGEKAKEYLKNFTQLNENILVVLAFSISKSFTGYGLRVGAGVAISNNEQIIEEFDKYFAYMSKSAWSNISKGGTNVFAKIINDDIEFKKLNEEKNCIVEIMKRRSEIFLENCKKENLDFLPYKSGFFVTVYIGKDILTKVVEELKSKNIFILAINDGYSRITISCICCEKLKTLPKIIRETIEFVKSK